MAQMKETVLHSFGYAPKGTGPASGVIRDAAGNFYGITSGGGSHNSGVIYRVDAASNETVLYNFIGGDELTGGNEGCTPSGQNLIGDGAGNLYGTMVYCGSANGGVVYKLDKTAHLTVLHTFAEAASGMNPRGLVRDAAGNLYGTTSPQRNGGVVYKLDPAGNYAVLHTFTGGSDGNGPQGLIVDSTGNLYGTTYNGGVGAGVVFKLTTSGTYSVLYSFTGGADGGQPGFGLLRDRAGNLYGLASKGGSGSGVLYKVDATGHETVLHTFAGGATDACSPGGTLSTDASGNLYGLGGCGAFGFGAIFKIDRLGNETLLHSFSGAAEGKGQNDGLILDSAGNVYGTSAFDGPSGAGLLYRVDPTGNLTTLTTFTSPSDGAIPLSGLISDGKGNLIGTASTGGPMNAGILYRWNAKTHLSILHAFSAVVDGGTPQSSVISDSVGNLYGTTIYGGNQFCGTVYKVDPVGQETVLYSFYGGIEPHTPFAGLIRDSAGNLYTTATYSGVGNAGAIFRIAPSTRATVLYSFTGGTDGGTPESTLVGDAGGNLYGTTSRGGAADVGVVFRLDRSGRETVLYSFAGGIDGGTPSGVVRDLAGNLYGTTETGGPADLGTIFKLDPSGHKTILYSFSGMDGASPSPNIVFDSSGNIYGSTFFGGTVSRGVVYKLDPAGHQTVLYNFTGGIDGAGPNGNLLLDAAGNIYGTTKGGGTNNGGVIFMLTNAASTTVSGE